MGFSRAIVGCTGNVMENQVEEFLRAGVNHVMSKPVTQDALAYCLHQLAGVGMGLTGNAEPEQANSTQAMQYRLQGQTYSGSNLSHTHSNEGSMHKSLQSHPSNHSNHSNSSHQSNAVNNTTHDGSTHAAATLHAQGGNPDTSSKHSKHSPSQQHKDKMKDVAVTSPVTAAEKPRTTKARKSAKHEESYQDQSVSMSVADYYDNGYDSSNNYSSSKSAKHSKDGKDQTKKSDKHTATPAPNNDNDTNESEMKPLSSHANARGDGGDDVKDEIRGQVSHADARGELRGDVRDCVDKIVVSGGVDGSEPVLGGMVTEVSDIAYS
eukprot:c937_g1_i1.p1 GENE.c937_g1_i1~~c937_g1_i1.p1  ORF type:complete len:339 (+),score=76.47 c937_g1_i1:53-1018(+)